VVGYFRNQFNLQKPNFGLAKIERHGPAKETLRWLIETTQKHHSGNICSKGHPLLSELGPEIYGNEIKGWVLLGYRRLSPQHVNRTLRRILEIALQTLVQLPRRFPKAPRRRDELRRLASEFKSIADAVEAAFRTDRRIRVFFGAGRENETQRLFKISEELRWGTEALTAVVAGTRKIAVPRDSSNPQVALALNFVGWIQKCTGNKHYNHLATLVDASFQVAGADTPTWVHRIEIEMSRRKARRKLRVMC
jgi:hypothetical protein